MLNSITLFEACVVVVQCTCALCLAMRKKGQLLVWVL
jgi:hypothetical protein